MSGTAAVATQFANAVTATGAQLDANYDTLVVYLNDPTNRNNYAAGGAVTNTVALTFAPPVVGGYTAGLELTWKWGTTNTGGVVVNANGIGNASLVNPDGSALAAGQATAGSIGKAVYDGTRFIFLAAVSSPATQAQMETATAAVSFVSPSTLRFSPYAAKAWGSIDGTVTGTHTITVGSGLGTSVRSGVGTYTINLATPFSSVNYAVFTTIEAGVGATNVEARVSGRTTAAFSIAVFNTASAAADDATRLFVAAFGDLP